MPRRAAGARLRGGLLRRPVPRLRADGREHVIIAAYWDDHRFARNGVGRIRTAHFGTGSDPSLRDTDGDGLEDGVEDGLGMSAISSDTDGDGLPDTWELDNGLDPLAPNGPDGADSDGDGVSDGAEVDQSSDPADASDGGVANSRVKVPLYFGDPSGSSSEKYRVDLTCVEGTSPSHYRVNSAYGRCDPVEVVLKPGSAYDVTIRHAGTKPLLRGRNGYPDYDYELTVLPAPPEVLVEDPQGLLGYHENDGARFPGKGKTARISALTPPSILAPDVVGVNDDDDDGNDVSDRDDQPITQGDDDLAEIKVRASFPGLLGWGIRFYLYSGATCATIWKDRLKTEFVNVGEMIHMEGGQLEKSFYLEGLSASRRFNDSQFGYTVGCSIR